MKIRVFVFMGILTALSAFSADAATTEPTLYRITVKKVEVSQNGGSSYVSVASGNRIFDLAASQSSGQVVGSYADKLSIAPGPYDTVRVTLRNTITLAGRILQTAGANTGTTFCTGGTTGVACTPANISINLTNALVAASGLTLPSGMTIDDAAGEIIFRRPLGFTIGEPSDSPFRMSIGIAAGLVIQPDDTMHPNVPDIRLTRG
jgi:hypothetical protein